MASVASEAHHLAGQRQMQAAHQKIAPQPSGLSDGPFGALLDTQAPREPEKTSAPEHPKSGRRDKAPKPEAKSRDDSVAAAKDKPKAEASKDAGEARAGEKPGDGEVAETESTGGEIAAGDKDASAEPAIPPSGFAAVVPVPPASPPPPAEDALGIDDLALAAIDPSLIADPAASPTDEDPRTPLPALPSTLAAPEGKSAGADKKADAKAAQANAQADAATPDGEIATTAADGKDENGAQHGRERDPPQIETRTAKTRTADADRQLEAALAKHDPAPAKAGAEQPLALASAAQTAAAANSASPAGPPPAAPAAIPVAGLAVEIAIQARAGKNRFEIRLDPPELGRIDVRLDVDRHGQVTSRLIVERAETLDLLRRDAPQLERALEQSGLKTSDNGLQFSLRGQSQHDTDRQTGGQAARLVLPEGEVPTGESLQRSYGRLLGFGAGIDIRV